MARVAGVKYVFTGGKNMNAHQIQNGIVVNTIVVDSLDILPDLIEATYGGIGWLWDGTTLTEPPVPPLTVEQIVQAMDNLFDSTAQSKRYDTRITCALRAGYTGPFQAEGQAFASWMDTCNALGYTMLAQVQAGTRPMPATVDEALALLPAMVWPA